MPLVAAAALPHTPQLLVRPETEDRDLVLRVHAGYAETKRLLGAARPDVICIVGGDHVEGFFLTSVPALAVYVGSSVSGTFDRYRYTFDVHELLARALLEQGIERGFDLAYAKALLRVGTGASRHVGREARAHRAAGLGRPLALPRQRPLRLPRLRLGPADTRPAGSRPRQRDSRADSGGARQGGQ